MASRDPVPAAQLVGVEGLALLRAMHEDRTATAARLAEVRELLTERVREGEDDDDAAPVETAPRTGYAVWSESYDEGGNPIVELEQPVVWSILDRLAPGRALDAACGTGRHSRRLADLRHTVTGVDLTPEMLARARQAVPEATFVEGSLEALPLQDASVDLVVCGLAIAHLADPAPAIAEFARVLAPGGQLIVTLLHPLQIQLGWHALFTGADGRSAFVREHAHGHAVYLRALRDCGLTLLDCVEPSLEPEQVRQRRRLFAAIPEAAEQAYVGLPAVLVWHAQRTG